MKKITFKMSIGVNGTEKKRFDVEGYRVDNKGIFAVHKFYDPKGEKRDSHPWRLSHVPTGQGTGGSYRFRNEATGVGLRLLTVPSVDWNTTDLDYFKGLDTDTVSKVRGIISGPKYSYSIKRPKRVKPAPEPDTVPEGMIGANDLKKGDRVTLHDGTMVYVWDNRKGIIRTVKVKSRFDGASWSQGSAYIADWRTGWIDGDPDPKAVYITKAQRSKLDRIKAAGIAVN